MIAKHSLPLAAAVVLFLPTAAPAQAVIKEINSQKLEELLKSMNIQYSKGQNDTGTTWYDYTSKNQKLRLWNFSGKDLMIDVFLPKVKWEDINKWNGTAKFSRARLHKDNKGDESSVIESNLDLAGGVTEETIKHFIKSFDVEVAVWLNNPAVAKDAAPAVVEEEMYKNVTAERLEKILDGLNIKFKKTEGKNNNNVSYYFERNDFKIRLVNFNERDLMIDCVYQQAPPLSKVNEWNVKRPYVRAVFYPNNGNPYTALECNLDCLGGTSDSIIRHFITTFDGEVTAFDKHLKGAK